MHTRLLLAALSLLPTTLSAQAWRTGWVTPIGAEFFEGNSASDIMLGNWSANTRTQQIDNNLVGRGLSVVRYIGFRRNGTGNVGAAKKTDLTVILSHADYNTISSTFASNYKDPPRTVFTKKSVNLPDWNTPVTVVPSPFDVVLPFDVPFLYNRQDALLFDILNENNPLGIYTQDWVSGTVAHTYGDYPTNLGGGCKTANGTMVQRCGFRANATTMNLLLEVDQAPSSAPVVALVGASDWNLAVGCGTLHATPLLVLSAGATDAKGYLKLTTLLSLPWNPAFASVTLFVQGVALDGSQPVLPMAFANGLQCPAPASGGAGQINVKRIYHTSSTTSATGTGPSVSAVPAFYSM